MNPPGQDRRPGNFVLVSTHADCAAREPRGQNVITAAPYTTRSIWLRRSICTRRRPVLVLLWIGWNRAFQIISLAL